MSSFDGISTDDYHRYRDRRFGQTNPERMDNPFWEAMIRNGLSAWHATQHFHPKRDIFDGRPVWCFDRMGMSRILLDDLSILFVGGEHEDHYDPDFCIYNDVVIRRWDGSIEIYGYPKDVFAPTDFHSATLVDHEWSVYIIGSIGYMEERVIGVTPVYVLDLQTMQIKKVEVRGPEPSLLHKHEALYLESQNAIVVWGGRHVTPAGKFVDNHQAWKFDLETHTWEPVDSVTLEWPDG